MLYSVSGKLIYKDMTCAVVECGGVGFRCVATVNTLKQLPKTGEDVFLYTYMYVREDNISLYGFFDASELECFKLLLTVSGVGAKAAVSILSQLTPAQLTKAVTSGDVNAIKQAQGIGVKTAQRIALELKSKLKGISVESEDDGLSAVMNSFMEGNNIQEATEALTALGYSRQEAARVLSRLDENLTVEELVREGLKLLSRQV